MKESHVILLSIMVTMAVTYAFYTGSGGYSMPSLTSSRTTFTWIGTYATLELAQWCNSLHFRNVVVRYVTPTEAQDSMDNLAQHGITYWHHVPGSLVGSPDNSVEGYKARLLQEIADSPSGNIYLDDTDATYNLQGETACKNLLEAVKQVQHDNIIVCFYYSDKSPYKGLYAFHELAIFKLMKLVDLSPFHIDIYYPPNYAPSQFPSAKTLGIYLWTWTGSGEYMTIGHNWDIITEPMINATFARADREDVNRMNVWMGFEGEAHESGMAEASLYLHPEWWDLITELNRGFLEG